ncbi:MAG TPA: hypothetical protein VLJ62_33180, partial [Burkholderiaceae bacterium]|nr:hypothetical protein [Burkholderiaceae bacterium]
AGVVVAFFSAVFLRGAPRDEVKRWAARVEQVIDSRVDPNLRIRAAMLLAKHYWYTGRFVLLRALRLRATPDLDDARIVPYSRLLWQLFVQYDCWARADTAGGRDAMRSALDAAQRCAIHLLDNHLTIHAAGFALVEGDLGAARDLLAAAGAHCHADRPAEQWHHAVTLAWLQTCVGEWQTALDAAGAALAAARRIGPAPTCLALAALAHAQRGAAVPEFEATLTSLRELAVSSDNHLGLWHWRCLTALAAARGGADGDAAGDALAGLIAGAAAQQLVAVPLAPRQVLSQLAATALRGGDAPPYIGSIIERWKLPPPAEFAVDARWPRPVRIVTLSEFRVTAGPRADTHQRETTKRKQTSLLQALIAIGPASGAQGITLETLADAVWPDADGDTALHSLEMAVHRLRAQLGAEAIEVHAGTIALSRRHCWVDAWELVALLDAIERSGGREVSPRAIERLVELLRGEFLPGVDAPWAAARRDSLRARIAGVISRLASAQVTAEIAPSVRELIRDLARGGRSRAVE